MKTHNPDLKKPDLFIIQILFNICMNLHTMYLKINF